MRAVNVLILGSTGSVGTQTLDVIAASGGSFKVFALCAGKNIELLKRQIECFRPRFAVVADRDDAEKLRMGVQNCEILCGDDAETELAGSPEVDIVVIASRSLFPLKAFYAAAAAGKRIAVSNKETIVACGDELLALAAGSGALVIPVDSEHNAIYQCLQGESAKSVDGLLLTCSGGAFRDLAKSELERVTAQKALAHPNWKMGAKITIDCATLANKGLEVIEAMRFFKVSADDIEVVLHRESIIHSMVRFKDGSVKALLSVPDMKLPISYALNYPDRANAIIPDLDFKSLKSLNFGVPDTDRFPCLGLALTCARMGGAYPLIFTSANDVAVEAFMRNKIGFYGINYYINLALEHFGGSSVGGVDAVCELDGAIKRYVSGKIDENRWEKL